MNRYSIKYEFLNTLYNGYAFFFGALFPIALSHLIITGVLDEVPDMYMSEAVTQIFIGMVMFVPLASIFLSHAATYSNELDKNIPERIKLFGLSESAILANKMVSNFVFLTLCLAIYFLGTVPFLDIHKPDSSTLVIWILGLYLLSALLLALSHAIATLIGKFGPTYGVVMTLYFVMMILGGYMGMPREKFPKLLRHLSDLLPTTTLGSDMIDLWMGRDYSFTPLIKSYLVFGTFCIALLLISFRVRGRKRKS